MERKMELVIITSKMVTITKDLLLMDWDKEKGQWLMPTKINIMENGKMTQSMEKGFTNSQMETFTKEILRMIWKTDKVFTLPKEMLLIKYRVHGR